MGEEQLLFYIHVGDEIMVDHPGQYNLERLLGTDASTTSLAVIFILSTLKLNAS